MRDIDMGSLPKTVLPVNTFLIYGDSKTGKTTFAGTAPRPLFLSDGSEHGYESLREENWDNDETPLFEANVRPIVWVLEKEEDFAKAVERARPLVEAKQVLSIWADSITFFADLIFNSILMAQTGKRDTRAAYGELGVRLRNVRIKLASLGVTVGWLAHAVHPSEDNPSGGPMIPGQQATKFAGGTDYVWYSRLNQPAPSQPGTFDIHTKKFGPYIAGHRLGIRGAQLPSPFRGNYGGFLDSIGYDVAAIRAALPPIDKARARAVELTAIAAKAAAAVPPVASQAAKPAVVVKPTVITNNGKTVAPTAKQ
jgi:hypothetical protein